MAPARLLFVASYGGRRFARFRQAAALPDRHRGLRHGALLGSWLVQLLAKRRTKVATVALANKIARIAWAIMTSGESYREPEPAAA